VGGTIPRDRSRQARVEPPATNFPPVPTIVEEEDDELISEETPPSPVLLSPSTPRSHTRYNLRPSPTQSPSAAQAAADTHLYTEEELAQQLRDCFRQAGADLEGPRLSRSQGHQIPDKLLGLFHPQRRPKK
jgi:hypothetical protein